MNAEYKKGDIPEGCNSGGAILMGSATLGPDQWGLGDDADMATAPKTLSTKSTSVIISTKPYLCVTQGRRVSRGTLCVLPIFS